jgi:polar amino acid transport system permease protein
LSRVSEFLGTTSALVSLRVLLIGAGLTLVVSLAAIALGFAIAVPICAARLSGHRTLRGIGAVYVSAFRGIPLLVQLLVVYYLLPFVGLELPSLVAAVIALGLCTAAYQAENLRGGFLIIPVGQAAAAHAFGYGRLQAWRYILLPQALRAAAPAVVNEMIAILKASSLVSVVGVADLTRVSQNIVARNMQPILWYSTAAAIYLVINLALAATARMLEQRLGRGMAQVAL